MRAYCARMMRKIYIIYIVVQRQVMGGLLLWRTFVLDENF